MKYKYSFDPVAAYEYEQSYLWYFEKSEEVAGKFFVAFNETIDLICLNPLRYRNSYKKLREVSLKKYPYYIVYLIEERKKLIIIISVYHHKRNPARKYRK